MPTDIDALKLIVKYPVIQNGAVTYLPDTIPIYYFRNYVLYQVPRTKSFTMNGELIRQEVIFDSFLFEAGEKFGFFFRDGEDSTQPAKVAVDSFLLERAYRSGFQFDFSRLLLIEKTVNREKVTEKWIQKAGTYGLDSVTLFFDKSYTNVPYSFNSKLDSSRKSKLIKISILIGESYSETYKMKLPRRDFKFEIRKFEIHNPQRIKDIIQHLTMQIYNG